MHYLNKIVLLIALTIIPVYLNADLFGGYSAGVGKISTPTNTGIPAFRCTLDAGFLNPLIGAGITMELPCLLDRFSLSGTVWYGLNYIYDQDDLVYTNGTVYMENFPYTGWDGIYAGVKAAYILDIKTNIESHSVELESSRSGNYIKTTSISAIYPEYNRSMIALDLTYEPMGSYTITTSYVNASNETVSNHTLLAKGSRFLLKLLYQTEYFYNFDAVTAYVLYGQDIPVVKNIHHKMLVRTFIGAATGITDGIGGYTGVELTSDNLYCRLEGGALYYVYRQWYIPFKMTIGLAF